MATTKISDIINPQVMADIIEAKIEAQAKLTPYAKVDTTLQGVAGDTVTVPSWNYVGDAEDFNPETAFDNDQQMSTSKLTAGTVSFGIKCAGKSISILQTAVNSGLGDPVGQANIQLAKAITGKVDNDVLATAYTAQNIYDGTANKIGYAGIVGAVCGFEDEEDGIEKVMFIHPEQEVSLLTDSQFISADKFKEGVAVNGAIGKVAGCWIKKSGKVTKVPAVEAVTAVAGVYKYAISTKAAANDRLKIGNVEIVAGSSDWSLSTDTATGNATALAATLNASTDPVISKYTWSTSTTTLIATEDAGYEGTLGKLPIVVTKGVSGTLAVSDATTGDTAGVRKVDAVPAHYKNPIIKMEPDSAETEYTEDELPALTIFLKKDIQVDHEWFPKKQMHDITVAKYYGVALTNASKVIIAKFKQ